MDTFQGGGLGYPVGVGDLGGVGVGVGPGHEERELFPPGQRSHGSEDEGNGIFRAGQEEGTVRQPCGYFSAHFFRYLGPEF